MTYSLRPSSWSLKREWILRSNTLEGTIVLKTEYNGSFVSSGTQKEHLVLFSILSKLSYDVRTVFARPEFNLFIEFPSLYHIQFVSTRTAFGKGCPDTGRHPSCWCALQNTHHIRRVNMRIKCVYSKKPYRHVQRFKVTYVYTGGSILHDN